MDYELKTMPAFERYIKKLKNQELKGKYKQIIKEILLNPNSGELKTGDLAGFFCIDFKYHGSEYELAYIMQVDEETGTIILVLAGTRENFYDELKRYNKIHKLNK